MEYVFTFLEGIASFVSPCVLPMVPIYVAYFAGKKENGTKNILINSLGFVCGFTLVFVLLSILASSLGLFISSNIKYLKIIFGVVMILFGLNYMELINIKELNNSKGINLENKNFNFFKSLLFGMLFSITWTPCVGVFLSSALLIVANGGELIKGIVLILLYSAGLGVPFIISALLIDRVKDAFNVIKKNYKIVKIISGLLLIIMGIYTIFIY